MTRNPTIRGSLLFDWGDTLMRDFPEYEGPMASWPRIELIPHVKNVLPTLHASWIIGLATNAQDSDEAEIRSALERGSIAGWIDEIFCFKRIGVKKPSPAFFDAILSDLRIKPRDAVFVGDSFDTDITGAVRSGLRAVWLSPRTEHHDGTLMFESMPDKGKIETIHHFHQLPAALDRLMQ